MSTTQFRLFSFAGHALITAAVIAGAGVLHAQSAQGTSGQIAPLNLQRPAAPQMDDAAFSSSTSAQEPLTTEVANNNTEQFHFLNAMQYGGGRQRYGRPRYRGGNTNPDGSSKYSFFVGGGLGIPIGTQTNYLTPSWAMQVGGGRNFNKHVGVNLQFDYDHFGMTGATINNQSFIYFGDATNPNGLDANSHIWSVTVDPIFYVYSGDRSGMYVTGGVGFYHKVANFTLPQQQQTCDPFYGCFIFQGNVNVDHYTSNAFGENVGVGLTYKISKFASEQVYAEVRYVHMDNQYRPGVTLATATTYNGTNFFPQNSQKTNYLPVKFGIRF